MNTWIEDFQERTDLNKYPVSLRTRGGIGYRKPNGETVSTFVGHPVHYFDGVWKPITLQTHSNGDFEGSDFSWRGGQILHKGKRLFEPRAVIFNGVRHNLNLRLDGNVLRATLPFGEYRILFMENGVREELVIPDPIEGLIEFDVPHAKKPAALHKKERHIVGGAFGESFKLTKDMNYPLVIDPDYAGDTADGYIRGDSTSFATARSTSTSFDTSNGVYTVGGYGVSGNYQVFRIFLKYNTSGIPDGDAVSAVTMTMWTNQVLSSAYSVDILIAKLDWSANDPISAGNRETNYDDCLAATLDNNILANSGAMVGNAAYTSGSLDTSWVNKTGSTYYGMLIDRDRNNLTFGDYQAVELHSSNSSVPSLRPYLTVTHAEAASSVPMPVIMY